MQSSVLDFRGGRDSSKTAGGWWMYKIGGVVKPRSQN